MPLTDRYSRPNHLPLIRRVGTMMDPWLVTALQPVTHSSHMPTFNEVVHQEGCSSTRPGSRPSMTVWSQNATTFNEVLAS